MHSALFKSYIEHWYQSLFSAHRRWNRRRRGTELSGLHILGVFFKFFRNYKRFSYTGAPLSNTLWWCWAKKNVKKGLLSWTIAENMRKIVQKNEVSIMKLSARRGLECRILHHLSQTPGRKGRRACSVRRTALCLLLFNFLLLLQNLLTSLVDTGKFETPYTNELPQFPVNTGKFAIMSCHSILLIQVNLVPLT